MKANLVALALGLILIVGCGDDDDGVVDPPGPPPPVTIQRLMQNLITSYQSRNIELYEELFDHNLFSFRFAPVDVGGDDPLPPMWNWPEERTSAGNMFAHPLVTTIELDFTYTTPRPVEESDDPPTFATQMLFINSLQFIVTTDNPDTGEVDRYVVEGDRQVFFFMPDSTRMQDGEPDWKIVEWRDEAGGDGLTATHETSWGAVKGLYR